MGRPLLPTLREKKRYLHYRIIEGNTDLKNQLKKILGPIQYAKSGIQTPKKNIIRCKADSLTKTKAALCLCKTQIKIHKVSGNIRG